MRNKKAISVALIDADRAFRERVSGVLKNSVRFRVTCCSSSSSVEFAELQKRSPHVLLIDVDGPPQAFGELVGALTQELPAAKVIVFTHRRDKATIFEALRAGAAGYVLKTVPLGRICEAIEHAYAGRSPLSPPVVRKLIGWFRTAAASAPPAVPLSDREQAVLALLAQGARNKQIATSLGIAEATVRAYLRSAYKKLNVRSRAQAVAQFRDNG
jgi:DNA-binding NarL/FixJ family response regulator